MELRLRAYNDQYVKVASVRNWTNTSGDTRHDVVLLEPLEDLPIGALIQGVYGYVSGATRRMYGVSQDVYPVYA